MDYQSDTTTQSGDSRSRFVNQKRFVKILLRRKVTIFSVVVITICIIVAIFAPLIAPYSPYDQELSRSLDTPSWQYLLGNDKYGRDILSRLIYGSRLSLAISFVAVGFGGTLGTTLGVVSGYFGGWTDAIIMRVVDAFLAIPRLITALCIAVVLGHGVGNIMLALGISIVPGFARLVRSVTLSVKENDYVLASRLIGASHLRTMFLHVLPNAMPQLLVHITIQMGLVILAEASLSFLGIGLTSNQIAWGSMVSTGQIYLITRPMLSLAPGVLVLLLALSWNLLGDGLRDALDPRLRGTL
ncbi:ABC transporter permease [Chloroflexota bacterium]